MSILNTPKVLVITAVLVFTTLLTDTSYAQSETASDSATQAFESSSSITFPDWFKESFLELGEDIQEASELKKRVVLMFHQDGCPYCNAFVEQNLSQKDIVETLQTKFDVIALNMWGDREVAHIDGKTYTEKEFAALLKVQFTPTTIFLTETAELALRINGYREPAQFRIALDYVATGSESSWTFNDYVAANGDKKKAGAAKERPYFTKPPAKVPAMSSPEEKPFVLLFEQKHCPNCEVLHDNILSKPDAMEFLSRLDVYRVDMWSDKEFISPTGAKSTGRELAKALGVGYAPTLVLYSKERKEIIRGESLMKSFHTYTMFDYVVSDAWRAQPSFQRFVSERADRLREEGVDVQIWE